MNLFLKLSSCIIVFLLVGCTRPYKNLINTGVPSSSSIRYKPVYDKVLYRCIVNGRVFFKKFHLSGLLLYKTLENGNVHAIFQNEMGYVFFDFEWTQKDSLIVRQIIPELDKEAIVRTLKKDMSLFLMKGLERKTEVLLKSDRGNRLYYRYNIGKGYIYYISEQEKLIEVVNADERRKVVTILLLGKDRDTTMPDSAFFNHHRANFTIALHKIE